MDDLVRDYLSRNSITKCPPGFAEGYDGQMVSELEEIAGVKPGDSWLWGNYTPMDRKDFGKTPKQRKQRRYWSRRPKK